MGNQVNMTTMGGLSNNFSPLEVFKQNTQMKRANQNLSRKNLTTRNVKINQSTNDVRMALDHSYQDEVNPAKKTRANIENHTYLNYLEQKIDGDRPLSSRDNLQKHILQEQATGKLSIVGTMSGDPFQQVHDQRTKNKRKMVNKVHTDTLMARTASNALKDSMQSGNGERIIFKDEDIREKLHKQAKLNHQSDIKKQI